MIEARNGFLVVADSVEEARKLGFAFATENYEVLRAREVNAFGTAAPDSKFDHIAEADENLPWLLGGHTLAETKALAARAEEKTGRAACANFSELLAALEGN